MNRLSAKNALCLSSLAILLAYSPLARAQDYCTPPSFLSGPYTGITSVKVGSFENKSSFDVGYKHYTEAGPIKVAQGGSYSMRVTTEHHLMNIGFTDLLNMAVWVDWNQDGDFEDENERVIYWNGAAPGTTEGMLRVPADAKHGKTRMRVYEDMMEADGHITPTPCGYLNEPNGLGQHGECEDYDLVVSEGNSTSIDQLPGLEAWSLQPYAQGYRLSLSLSEGQRLGLQWIDVNGRVLHQQEQLVNGTEHLFLPKPSGRAGLYLLKLQLGERQGITRIMQ